MTALCVCPRPNLARKGDGEHAAWFCQECRQWVDDFAVRQEIRLRDREAGGRCCRLCGCTDNAGCVEGCSWVEDDLCSACVEPTPFGETVDARTGRRYPREAALVGRQYQLHGDNYPEAYGQAAPAVAAVAVEFRCTSRHCANHEPRQAGSRPQADLEDLANLGCPLCGAKRLEIWHPDRGHILIDWRSQKSVRKKNRKHSRRDARRRRRERGAW